MKLLFFVIISLLTFWDWSLALDNGLALTPPMGWLSWERFRCNTDCEGDPFNCISERLIMEMADEMVLRGFRELGYKYVIVDDCWLSHRRDTHGRLQPDPKRFPSGIKALADYVHELGLKFGIYNDIGSRTCAGYPGLQDNFEKDAETFAQWGVDYVKVDGCNVQNVTTMAESFPLFGRYLNQTGRPMVYSCEWPWYWSKRLKTDPDYASVSRTCNLWRNYHDIQDSWEDLLDKIDFVGDNQDKFARFAGPGGWNDPDMLNVGNFALSPGQARVNMAMWSVLAAPLLMSTDLRTISAYAVRTLRNKNAIVINQDPLGHQGLRVFHDKKRKLDIFVRPVLPRVNGSLSAAAAVLYRGTGGTPVKVKLTPELLGLKNEGGYAVSEVFEGRPVGRLELSQTLTVKVNPVGVSFLRLDALPISKHRVSVSVVKAGDEIDGEEEISEIGVEDLGLSGVAAEAAGGARRSGPVALNETRVSEEGPPEQEEREAEEELHLDLTIIA